MAERRMFAKSIVLSDAFLDMPMSARCLYFTLGMLADDDGFIDSPKSIMRQCGASQDDMGMLLAKRFVLSFDSGVIVIKHWRINNYLRADRYTETTHLEEKTKITLKENNAYTEESHNESVLSVVGIPDGIPTVYPGKDSIDKNSKVKDSINIYGTQKNVKLTQSEYDRLITDYGEADTSAAIEYLSEYIADKGYKTKSPTHNLAMRRWVFDAVNEKARKGKIKPTYKQFESMDLPSSIRRG